MNTWFIETSVELQIAEMKREQQLRNSVIRQQLRESTPQTSAITGFRATVANALFSLGNVVKPDTCSDEWSGTTTTQHTAA